MKKIDSYRFISFFVAVIISSLLLITPSGAVSNISNAAQGLQISPALVDLNASRGSTQEITLNVMNITAADLVYSESVVDFKSSGETGSPQIVTDSDSPSTVSIRTWFENIPQFSLNAGKSKKIIARITIPNDAEPGGHYGVLRFSGNAPEMDTTGVGLAASTGVLILIRVDGDITEKASLASFYSSNSGKQQWFFENGPIEFTTRIKNDGNIHVKPSGNIEIRDMFGNLVSNLSINQQNPKSNILPDSIRRFESKLNKSWLFGKYTANLALGYGLNGQAITGTIDFWVIPYKLIITVLFVIATIIFILSRVMKAHNKRVIARYKRSENSSKGKKD